MSGGLKFGVEGTLSSPDPAVRIGGFSPETYDPNCQAPKTQTSVYGDVGPCIGPPTYTRFTFMVSSARSNDPIPFKLEFRNFQGPQGTILFSKPMNPNTLIGQDINPTPPDVGTIYAVHNFPSGDCPDGKGILWYWEPRNCYYAGCGNPPYLNCPYYADHWNYYTGWLAILQQYGIYTHVADYRTGDCHAPCNAGRWDPSSNMCQFLDCYADSDPYDYYFLISGEYACMPDGRGAEGTLGYANPPTEKPYGGGNCHQ